MTDDLDDSGPLDLATFIRKYAREPDEMEEQIAMAFFWTASVWEKTPELVRVVVTAARDPQTPNRAKVLGIIVEVARHSAWIESPPEARIDMQPPGEAQRVVIRETYRALWEGVPAMLAMIEGDDLELRRGAACALGAIHAETRHAARAVGAAEGLAERIPAILLARLEKDSDDLACAAVFLGLGMMAAEMPNLKRTLIARLSNLNRHGRMARLVAAYVLQDLDAPLPIEAVEVLLAAAEEPALHEKLTANLPWVPALGAPALGDGPLKRLEKLGEEHLERAKPALRRIFASARITKGEASGVFALVFPPGSKRTRESLTAFQREVLGLIVANEAAWPWESLAASHLGRSGLPTGREEVRAMVGLPPAPSRAAGRAEFEEFIKEALLQQAARLALAAQMPKEVHIAPSDVRRKAEWMRPKFRVKLADSVNLRSLDMSGKASDALLEYLRLCPNVEELYLGQSGITDAGAASLAALPHLKTLRLNDTCITDAALKSLRAEGLEQLALSGRHLTGAGLTVLAGIRLRALFLREARVAGAGEQAIGQLKSLERLLLEGTNFSDAGLAAIAGLTQLRQLWLDGTCVTGAGLRYLAGMSQLSELKLCDTPVASLAELPPLPCLTSLAARGTQITALAPLPPRLDKLSLDGAPLTSLAGMQRLESLRHLSLNDTQVTDETLANLPELAPNLRSLDLDGTVVTDGILSVVRQLSQLNFLHIRGTGVTRDAAAALQAEWPELGVTWTRGHEGRG